MLVCQLVCLSVHGKILLHDENILHIPCFSGKPNNTRGYQWSPMSTNSFLTVYSSECAFPLRDYAYFRPFLRPISPSQQKFENALEVDSLGHSSRKRHFGQIHHMVLVVSWSNCQNFNQKFNFKSELRFQSYGHLK